MVDSALSITFVVVLITLSGLFSGLTLGLMGLDISGLEVVMAGGSDDDKRYAAKIFPLRKDGNLLLCTLLLGNVAVNAALSILLAALSDGLTGFLVSTIVIVIAGEIVPQAFCSRHPLYIGATAVPLVKVFLFVLYPITRPLAYALDRLLGDEVGTFYNKNEFKKVIEMQQQRQAIRPEEAQILEGALDFGQRLVGEIMTPIEKAYMLDVHRKLDFTLLSEIFKAGFSRIPVFDEQKTGSDKVVGLLLVKDLILLDPADAVPVQTIINFYGRQMPRVFPDTSLWDLMETFKSGRSHMALIQEVNNDGPGDPYYFNVGLVTLEDLIETIIGQDIKDETDDPSAKIAALGAFDSRRLPANAITPQEASAIFWHLTGTVDIFTPRHRQLSELAIKRLLQSSRVVDVAPEQLDADAAARTVEEGGATLYSRGSETEYFSLLLDGHAEVRAGSQGFTSEVGRWSVLCADMLEAVSVRRGDDAVEADAAPYVADFTATLTEKSRVLRVSRSAYVAELVAQSPGEFDLRRQARPAGVSPSLGSLAPVGEAEEEEEEKEEEKEAVVDVYPPRIDI